MFIFLSYLFIINPYQFMFFSDDFTMVNRNMNFPFVDQESRFEQVSDIISEITFCILCSH